MRFLVSLHYSSFSIEVGLIMVSCVSPVVEVHDGLEGVPSSRGDVSFKAREQRGDHVHAVLLTLPVSKQSSVTQRQTDRQTDRLQVSSCEKQKQEKSKEKQQIFLQSKTNV